MSWPQQSDPKVERMLVHNCVEKEGAFRFKAWFMDSNKKVHGKGGYFVDQQTSIRTTFVFDCYGSDRCIALVKMSCLLQKASKVHSYNQLMASFTALPCTLDHKLGQYDVMTFPHLLGHKLGHCDVIMTS